MLKIEDLHISFLFFIFSRQTYFDKRGIQLCAFPSASGVEDCFCRMDTFCKHEFFYP